MFRIRIALGCMAPKIKNYNIQIDILVLSPQRKVDLLITVAANFVILSKSKAEVTCPFRSFSIQIHHR
jgi:hypothetical protein